MQYIKRHRTFQYVKLIDDIVHMFMEFQQKENTVIPHLEHELAETEKAINNMLNAIEQGIITPMTKKRLDALEEKHRNIETDIVKEKMNHPLLTEEQVRFWFERMREYDITVLEQRKRLIDTFVNAIFVYNDRLLFTFNYKRDAKTVLFSDLKSSDITKGVRPYRVFIPQHPPAPQWHHPTELPRSSTKTADKTQRPCRQFL